MHMNKGAMRSATFAAIFGLALTTGAVGAPVAFAAEGNTPAPVSTIDAKRTGSLTIIKKADPDSTGTPTGLEDPAVKGEGLPNVKFKVERITDADLTTNEGMAEAARWKVADVAGKAKTTVLAEGTTGEGGKLTVPDLPVGLYLVTETESPTGYAKAAPFLVFLPLTKDAPNGGTEWNYDVVAYPKNYKNTVEKTVVDADKNTGDVVDFKVTANVPVIAKMDTAVEFTIRDDFEAEQAEVTEENINAIKVWLGADKTTEEAAGTKLEKGTHYNVVKSDVDGFTRVEVQFTEEGLKLLKDNQGKTVIAAFQATAKEVGNTDGILNNTATTISDNGSGGGKVETPSEPTTTRWGKLRINKFDATKNKEDEGYSLAGAEFEAYLPKGDVCSRDDLGAKISIKKGDTVTDKWVTNAKGEAIIDGLHVTDKENNDQDIAKFYCLVETKAPTGFMLMPEPIKVELKSDDLKQVGDDVKPVSHVVDVPNEKDTTPNLPLTGGSGIGVLAAIGAALVAAGAWFARRTSKQS